MANKTIQVNLQFNADVSKAKSQMESLQQQLSNLTAFKQSSNSLGVTKQMDEAARSAMQLKIALQNATNVNTGKLNLNKFQAELNQSGKTLEQYAAHLRSLGPAGIQAFNNMASAIANADTKIFSLQGGMKKLMDTFANTVRWQLTSSLIQGVTSSIRETVSYAKELDTSLNNIRIVTGKSADSMAKFAKQANTMAKELSTTTKKYSDASLIYFQQGLNDAEVKKRTDVTVKLANVVGENASEVSEWMTAIWNNFDDGSESLEYYADVITKLGAATASSADEIAGGLEKFAAVGETIGLSFEYATAALATITAETRQSEDVVGTALKTLFSRMEQLKLGDTLDDGTTLGKYSLALETVGVSIKDANGELKDMDTILQATGERWSTLARDEQIALAQSVAGIRQYTQFMALMDNWNVMEKNLELTEQANGALEEQHSIYEESAEAAKNRMTAAGEEIKALLLGGEDLKGFYQFGADSLEWIGKFLDAFGGLPTILWAVATALTKIYQPQIASFAAQAAVSFKNMWHYTKDLTRHPIKTLNGEMPSANQEFKQKAVGLGADMAVSDPSGGVAQSAFSKQNLDIQNTLIAGSAKLTEAEKQIAQWQFQQLQDKQQQIIENEKLLQQTKELNEQKSTALSKEHGFSVKSMMDLGGVAEKVGAAEAHGKMAETAIITAQQNGGVSSAPADAAARAEIAKQVGAELDLMKSKAEKLDMSIDTIELDPKVLDSFKKGKLSLEELLEKVREINIEMSKMGDQKINDAIEDTQVAALGGPEEMARREEAARGTITSLSNLSEDADINTTSEQLNSLNAEDFSSQADQEYIQQKQAKAQALADEQKALLKEQDLLKDKQQWMKKNNKTEEEWAKAQKDNNKALTKNNKAIKTFNKQTSQSMKNLNKKNRLLKKDIKQTKDFTKAQGKTSKGLQEYTKDTRKAGEDTEKLATAQDDATKSGNKFKQSIENASTGSQHWSTTLVKGIGVLAQYAMSLNILTSSFETLSHSIASGDATWKDWVSSISTALMSLGMLIPVITKVTSGISNSIKAKHEEKLINDVLQTQDNTEISLERVKMALQDKKRGKTKQEIADNYDEATSNIVEAVTENSKNASSPATWPAFVAGLAMIGTAAAMVGMSIAGGASGGAKEAKEEKVSKGTENLEAINENQELAGTVDELTEEYDRLRATGQSTADVLEDMKEQIPDLINSYEELSKTLGSNIDISSLKEAYDYFLTTGDISLFQAEQEKVDNKIQTQKKDIASNTVDNAADLMLQNATEGWGRETGLFGWGGNYTIDLGEPGEEANKILSDAFGDMWDGDNVEFNEDDETAILNYYNNAVKAREKLKEAGLEDTAAYERLSEDIVQMSEYAEDALAAQNEKFQAIQEELLKTEDQGLGEIELSDGINAAKIADLETYKEKRAELIKKLSDEHDITEQEAEIYLKNTKALGDYEKAVSAFGETDSRTTQVLANMGKEGLEQIQNWYAGLSDEEKTLALGIDYSLVFSEADAEAALEEARKKMEINTSKANAEALEVSGDTFDAYTDILLENNDALKDNKVLAAKAAEANIRLNKGIENLQKNWTKSYKALSSNNKTTLEYATAMGEVQKALEDTFGIKPSTKFIENNLGLIGDLAAGDIEALDELQKAMAQDYVANMVINDFSVNESAMYGTAEDVRQKLQNLLSDIDTGLDLGDGSTVSEDYLNSLQQMIDSGQITEEQLTSMLNAKGYHLEVTGYKEVDGPKKTITRTITHEDGSSERDTIEEQEKIQVPIINGDASTIKADGTVADAEVVSGKAGKANLTKITDKRAINSSLTAAGGGGAGESKEDRKKRVKDLNAELDRYHEINEILDDISKRLDKISAAKDRAFGQKKIDLIGQEVAAYEAEAAAQDKLAKQTKAYLDQTKKELSQYGLKTDASGNVSNFSEREQFYAQRLANTNKDDEDYAKYEEEYEAFKEAVSNYEDTYDEYEDAITAKTEAEMKKIDAILEGVDYSVEIKIEANERQLAYLERTLERLDDDLLHGAERIDNWSKQVGDNFENIKTYSEGLSNTLKTAGIDVDVETILAGDLSALEGQEGLSDAVIQKIYEYTDGIAEAQAAIEELQKQIQEEVMVTFNAWHEKMEETQDSLGTYGEILDNYQNIVDIAGPGYLGISSKVLAEMNKAGVDVAMATFKAAQDTLQYSMDSKTQLQKDLEDAIVRGDSEEMTRLKEDIEEIDQQILADQAAVGAAWGDTLTEIYESFGKNVENILNDFQNRMAGTKFSSFDQLTDAMEKQKEVSDLYVADYKKIYELSKMNRDIQEKIDNTDSLKGKQALADMQAEIASYQKEGKVMSEYELENLQKKYDLRLAEIALEEAQNAKSQVKLQQDSQGNWGYVYTANDDATAKAEQTYEDKLFAMQEANTSYIEQMETNIAEVSQRMYDEIAALDISQFATREEYDAEVARITAHYVSLQEAYMAQMGLALENNGTLYTEDWMKYSEATGYKITADENWVNDFSETRLSILTGYDSLEDYHSQFVASTTILLGDLGKTYEKWESQVKTCMEQAGVDTETLGQGVAGFKDNVANLLTGEQEDSVINTITSMVTGANGLLLGEEGSLNATLIASGTSFKNLKDKIGTELGTNSGAGKKVNDFDSVVKAALYGEGGTKDSPKGGVIKGIADTMSKFTDMKTTANKEFTDAATAATIFATKFNPEIESSKKSVDNLEKSIADLSDKWADTDIDVKALVKGKDDVDDLYDSIEKLHDETVRVTYKEIRQGSGSSGGNGGTGTDSTPNYKFGAQSEAAKNVGLYRVEKLNEKTGKYEYQGYTKNQNIIQNDQLTAETEYKYLIYDNNADNDLYGYLSKNPEPYSWKDTHKADDNSIKKDKGYSFLGANGNYSSMWDDDGQLLANMLKDRTGYIQIDGKPHYGFQSSKYTYFFPIGHFWEGNGAYEDPHVQNWASGYRIENQYVNAKKFDTGGYTGEWGPEGRMAMLHQKEIVLNAHDTENFLAAIGIVRNIAERLDQYAAITSQGLGTISASVSPAQVSNSLDQNVTIHAEFPNATDHNEIEMAFDNLVNKAAQFASRK